MKKLASAFLLTLCAGVVFAATTGDRLKSPVMVGQGASGTLSIDFDTGNGSNDAKFVSTANTSMATYINGTNRLEATTSGITVAGNVQTSSVSVPDGTAGVPTYKFSDDTDTGFFRESSNTIGVATGGARTTQFTTTGIRATDGTDASPSYGFASDPDTGFFLFGLGSIGVTANGIESLRLVSTGVQAVDGSAASPVYSFSGDTNTGIYRGTTDKVAISGGGVNVASFSQGGAEIPAGNGAFKVAVFTGSITAGSGCSGACSPGTACGATCPTVSGTILGVFGWSGYGGSSSFRNIIVEQPGGCGGGSPGSIFINGSNQSTTTKVTLSNCDSLNTNTYGLTVFYQP